MTTDGYVFLGVLAVILAAILYWSLLRLTGERWQVLATVPLTKNGDGQWRGLNLTWYGVLNANAVTLGAAILFILMAGLGVPVAATAAITAGVLLICLPAARIVAMIIEKKKHTFTVGGASFVGLLVTPLVVLTVNELWGRQAGFRVPAISALAAIGICYTIGEGVGRVACISFGCCYGKRLAQCPPWMQRLFRRWHFVFHGPIKKASYEGCAEGEPLVPIQGITAVLLSAVGLMGIWLFLQGWHAVTFIFVVTVSQIWRLVSEFFRADFRGFGSISPYQKMAIVAVPIALVLGLLLGGGAPRPVDVAAGVSALWDPLAILFLQVIWVAVFLFMGRSEVTTARVAFSVLTDRV